MGVMKKMLYNIQNGLNPLTGEPPKKRKQEQRWSRSELAAIRRIESFYNRPRRKKVKNG